MTRLQSFSAIALAVLLVGSSVGPIAMSQPATAQDDTISSCDAREMSSYGWLYNKFFADCSDASEEEFADKLDTFQEGKSLSGHVDTALTMAENNVPDAENQAWMEAESAFFEAYQDGANKSVATQAGIDAIESHYAMRQNNLIELQNNVMVDLYTTFNESKHFSIPGDESSNEFLLHRNQYYPGITMEHKSDKFSYHMEAEYTWSEPTNVFFDLQPNSFSTQQVTLADGSSTPVNVFDVRVGVVTYYDNSYHLINKYGTLYPKNISFKLIDGEHHARFYESDSDHTKEVNVYFSRVETTHYPDEYPMETSHSDKVTNAENWADIWTSLQDSLSEQKTEWETFANQSYNDLEAPESDFSADDILSRLTQMNEYTLDLGNENASFNDAVAGLAASGFSMPDSESAYMNLTYQTPDGETRTDWGMLMSREAPPGGWNTSTTYNTTDLPTNPIVVDENGTQRMVKGDLRIDGVYDRNGTQIENPDLESPDRTYKSTNLTDLRQDILNLSAQVSEIRNRTATPGGGGAAGGELQLTWPDVSNPLGAMDNVAQYVLIALALLALIAVLGVLN